MQETNTLIQQDSVSRSKNAFLIFQKLLVTLLLVVSAFYGGYYFGKRGYLFEIRRNPPNVEIINRAPTDEEVDFGLFWQVWELVRTKYLERPIDTKQMMYGAIKGMVQSLDDPYTSFLPPQMNESVNNSLNGTYEGIGAELGIREEQLIIVAPLDGSPAKEAGIKAGDKILEIEGEPTVGITLTEAVAQIRGESGTISTLTMQRGSEEPFVARIKRGQIHVDSITWEDKGDGVAYIRVSRFGGETNNDWSKAAKEVNVQMNELDAIIVDVRGNPGGYLQSAIYIAGEFFTDKPVLYEETAVGEQIPFNAGRPAGVFEDLPVYVLIDGGSASASEILAAALRDQIDAVLVGEKSFGKGTIQDADNFPDGSGVHITVAKWLTPEKEWIHDVGLEPAVTVELSQEDIETNNDRQLLRAIELAKEGVTNEQFE